MYFKTFLYALQLNFKFWVYKTITMCMYWSTAMEQGLEEPNADVAALISHATQERLKNFVEKLAVIAEHRMDIIKVSPSLAYFFINSIVVT